MSNPSTKGGRSAKAAQGNDARRADEKKQTVLRRQKTDAEAHAAHSKARKAALAAERAKAVQKMLFEEGERLSSSAAVAAQRLRRSRSMTLPTADRYAPSDSRQMSGKVWTDMGTVEYRMSSDLLEQMRSKARGPSPHRTQPSVAPSISPSPPPLPSPQPRPRYHEPLCPPLTLPLIPLPHPAAEGARPPSAPARQAAPPPLLYRRACRAARRRRCRAAAASFRRRRARGCSPRLAQPATCELDRAARVARRACPIARGGRGGGRTTPSIPWGGRWAPSIPWAPSVPWRDAQHRRVAVAQVCDGASNHGSSGVRVSEARERDGGRERERERARARERESVCTST